MADSSPPTGLLDRASHLLELVGELANGIREHIRLPVEEKQPCQRRIKSAWEALLPAVIEAGQSLPPDPNPVADWIRELGRVSRWFDDATQKQRLEEVLFQSDGDWFIGVAEKGRALLKQQTANRDPFAFVDERTAEPIDLPPAKTKGLPEVPAEPATESLGPSGGQTLRPNYNALMIDTLERIPESKDWTIRQWVVKLGCKSTSTVQGTLTWKGLMQVREEARKLREEQGEEGDVRQARRERARQEREGSRQ